MNLTRENFPIHFDYSDYVDEHGDALAYVDTQLADQLSELIKPGADRYPWSVSHHPIDTLVDAVLIDYVSDPARYTAAANTVIDEILRPIAARNRKAELITWVYDIDLGPHATDTAVRDAKKYLLKRALIATSNTSFAFSCISRRGDLNEEDRDEPSALYRLYTMCAVHALGDYQL